MAISFPTSINPMRAKWNSPVVAGVSDSIFTRDDQAQLHQGFRWMIELTFRKMTWKESAPFRAFLLAMDGVSGLCSYGDPTWSQLGSGGGTPLVNGDGQTGTTLNVKGLPIATSNIWLPGEMISIAGSNYPHLHMVLAAVNSDGSGHAAVSIRPRIREAADGNIISLGGAAAGVFRFQDNNPGWEADEALHYAISCKLTEHVSVP